MPLKMVPENEKEAETLPKAQEHIVEERSRLQEHLARFQHRIGVHSGKGGVGKTFIACNLARLLSENDNQVGLLDADVDCPNVPAFLGLKSSVEIDAAHKLVPVKAFDLEIMSTAFLQEEGEPLIIRGPIKHRLLTDFVEKTAWSALDYLVIDFPPGTSDVPLSAMQFLQLDGVLLVTTPQKESALDVTKAAGMARKLSVPILGLIENMEGEVFGSAGEALAKKLDVPFLGSIPLAKEIRVMNDTGKFYLLEPQASVIAKSILSAIKKA